MKMTEESKNATIANIMDLATNIDNFRQVIILTITHDGILNVIQKKSPDATDIERLGIYNLMAKDTRDQIMARWEDSERPMKGDSDEEA